MNSKTVRASVAGALGSIIFGAIIFVALVWPVPAQVADPLSSWNAGANKSAILDFVAKVTRQGDPAFVPQAERIAVFDNDGTLWGEQPLYFQFLFAIDRVKAMAQTHPEWQTREPFASILKGDIGAALTGGEQAIAQLLAATHAGMTTDEFAGIAGDWLATAQHPKFKRRYTELVYQPMLEVLAHLRASGFKTYIVSGGGIEFIRIFSERVYGIPPEQVIGSSGKLKLEVRDGKPVLVKLPEVNFVDDKEGKPAAIQLHIGRRPIMAFGNSDGDFEMLEWTTAGSGARLGMFVHHDDGGREFAYDRKSSIGRLLRGLDEAPARGWIVTSMKNDWRRIFAFEN
jgi:phosphoglycolate phosphatase-like HAD superfamily hydrolase